MSPFYLFSTAEMAVLLNKSPITIRLEARKKHIGTKKDGRFYFNDDEKRRMIESFMGKKRAIVSSDIPIMTAVMRRMDVMAEATKRAIVDTQRTTLLLREIFDKLSERIEALEEKLKKEGG